MKATGTFTVKLNPLDAYAQGVDELKLGHLSIDKQFEGDLVGSSKGEMLSAMTSVKGSAGYVAIELVSGTLSGKTGNFVLQHFGIMHEGKNRLILEVVPNSGAGELSGLSGNMTIDIEKGRHDYAFEYELM
jgi:hypothetical protein